MDPYTTGALITGGASILSDVGTAIFGGGISDEEKALFEEQIRSSQFNRKRTAAYDAMRKQIMQQLSTRQNALNPTTQLQRHRLSLEPFLQKQMQGINKSIGIESGVGQEAFATSLSSIFAQKLNEIEAQNLQTRNFIDQLRLSGSRA